MMNNRQSSKPPSIPMATRINQGKGAAPIAKQPTNSRDVEIRYHQLRNGCSWAKGSVARIRARSSGIANSLQHSNSETRSFDSRDMKSQPWEDPRIRDNAAIRLFGCSNPVRPLKAVQVLMSVHFKFSG